MEYTWSKTKMSDAQIKCTKQLKKLNHVIKFINEKIEEFQLESREK